VEIEERGKLIVGQTNSTVFMSSASILPYLSRRLVRMSASLARVMCWSGFSGT
jgi:hypothetical protein